MKITAQELRIGNLVECCKEICNVTCISKDGMSLQSDENLYVFEFFDEVAGITLTAEWLIKFGFISERTGIYKEQWLLYKKDDLTLNWRNEFCEFGWVESIEIKYVHQLQNLYFVLTGEELQINI